MPPGSAACVASLEYHVRNSRSMNHMIDQKQVCTISGSATASTSRPPHGRDHQPVPSGSGDRMSEAGAFFARNSSMLLPSTCNRRYLPPTTDNTYPWQVHT